jgi:succinate dehydrogenase / fumarate reductase membrane anchor subunit
VCLVLRFVGTDYAEARAVLANPLVTVALAMLILSGTVHMRLGMQTVIEDYIHSEGIKIALLMANTFFAIAIGATCILAVLKLGFGG